MAAFRSINKMLARNRPETKGETHSTMEDHEFGRGSSMTGALLTEPEVADRLRVSLACLRRWRLERRGPRFVKVGSLVRYPAEELDRWLESLPAGGSQSTGNGSRRVGSTAQI